jgi:hypothetical protein
MLFYSTRPGGSFEEMVNAEPQTTPNISCLQI